MEREERMQLVERERRGCNWWRGKGDDAIGGEGEERVQLVEKKVSAMGKEGGI